MKPKRLPFQLDFWHLDHNSLDPLIHGKLWCTKKIFTNTGNAYDPNTGTFTAPVNGVYFFRFYAHAHPSNQMAVSLHKNDKLQCSLFFLKPETNANGSNGVVLSLRKGDEVYTQLWENSCVSDDENSYTSFSRFSAFPHEVKLLMSTGDGISGCIFLGEELLATTSFDGQVEVWDVASGCRTAHMKAHSIKITGCDVSPDQKLFATVSLDLNLKVWSAQKSTKVASLMNPSPLNCVNFDLEGQLVAVGCWDGAVHLWNWLEQKNITTLLGHQSSVRSLSFSPCSSMLCSGCLSEVQLWSVTAAACVGSYHTHRGSMKSLNFLQGENLLLSVGHDSVVHVWSGGLGKTVAVLGEEKALSCS